VRGNDKFDDGDAVAWPCQVAAYSRVLSAEASQAAAKAEYIQTLRRIRSHAAEEDDDEDYDPFWDEPDENGRSPLVDLSFVKVPSWYAAPDGEGRWDEGFSRSLTLFPGLSNRGDDTRGGGGGAAGVGGHANQPMPILMLMLMLRLRLRLMPMHFLPMLIPWSVRQR
jgi:hypothetical protein